MSLGIGLLIPNSAIGEVPDIIHKRCLEARDYSGCVRINQSSSLIVKREMTGIGLTISLNPETAELTIQSIIKGSPAAAADIEAGDVILKIEGKSKKELV